MPSISSLICRLIYDSRGSKALELDVVTDKKFLGRACAPSGASVGKHEAQSFPQNSPERALETIKSNESKFIGTDASSQRAVFDVIKSIDNTETYSIIGGAASYAISVAAVHSASKALEIPLFKLLNPEGPYRYPYPLGNILGGGAHAGPGTPDIQEILVCPIGAKSIFEALNMNFQVHKEVRAVIEALDPNFTYGRGDEGGWAPRINNDRALEIAELAVKNSGYSLGTDISLGIDFASSSFWDDRAQLYNYRRQGLVRTREEQIDYVNQLINQYDLIYVEDPVNEEDFEGAANITKKNKKCIITGDDMLVTNTSRVKMAAGYNACSGAILKVNQAGSLYEAMDFADKCSGYDIKIIASHRSGESIDSHLSHIGIAANSKMLKAGIVGGERVSKLNELVRLTQYGLIDGMAELFSTI
jgi:enolase